MTSLSTALLKQSEKSIQLIKAIGSKHTTVLALIAAQDSMDCNKVIEQIGISDIESVCQQLIVLGQILQFRSNLLQQSTLQHRVTQDTDLSNTVKQYYTCTLVSILPTLLGIVLLSHRWKQVQYAPITNSMTHNLHLNRSVLLPYYTLQYNVMVVQTSIRIHSIYC